MKEQGLPEKGFRSRQRQTIAGTLSISGEKNDFSPSGKRHRPENPETGREADMLKSGATFLKRAGNTFSS